MTEPKTTSRGRELLHRPYVWGIAAIVLLLLLNTLKDPGYLAISVHPESGNLVGNVIDILRASVPILMVAVGMALVIATGGIDLSVGSIMAVGGATAMQFLSASDDPSSAGASAAAIGLALLISTALGAVNGILVAFVRLQPFICTLIMMLAGRGIAKVITDGRNTAAESDPLRWIVNGYVFGFPFVFVLAIAIVIAVGLIVRRSALGLMIEAIGINLEASRMAGIRPRGLLLTVYIFSGALAGVAGLFAVGTVMTVDVTQTGYLMELDAILAVVIGGTALYGGKFSLGGAVVGALLIATLDKTVLFLGIPSSASPAFKAVVIIVVCLLQSGHVRRRLRRRRSHEAPPGAVPTDETQKQEAVV